VSSKRLPSLSPEWAELYENIHALAAPFFPLRPFGKTLERGHPHVRLALVTSTHRDIMRSMNQIHGIHWSWADGYEPLSKYTKSIQIEACLHHFGNPDRSTVYYTGDSASDGRLAEQHNLRYWYPGDHALREILEHAEPLASVPKVHQG
jgi:hypothetical protein